MSTPAIQSHGVSHVLLACSAADVKRVLTDLGLEVVVEDSGAPTLDVGEESPLDLTKSMARLKMATLLEKLPHPALAEATISNLALMALAQIVFKDEAPTSTNPQTVMVTCVLVMADGEGHGQKEYISNMRLQLSLLPSPLAWALQTKHFVPVRDVLLKMEIDTQPMVNATSLAIQAMASGLVLDALNDTLHTWRMRHKRTVTLVDSLDDWDYGDADEEEETEGGSPTLSNEGTPVKGPDLNKSFTPEKPKTRAREGSLTSNKSADMEGNVTPVSVYCSVNCLATACAACGTSFDGGMRQMWCPTCYNTICPSCCSTPLATMPDSFPAVQCRQCMKSQLRAYKANHLMGPSDPWAKDEALHGGDCDICGGPFSFFKRRFYCQQCLRRVCTKCLVGYTSSLESDKPTDKDKEKDRVKDKDKDQTGVPEAPSKPRCIQCSGKEQPKRQEGVDWSMRQCTLCNVDFTFLVRRHWCRQCHRTICSDCSAYPLSGLQRSHPDCMCMQCYKERFSPGRRGVDKSAPSCLLCGSKFTVFWRRHWCRKCCRTICTSCSAVSLSFVSRRHPNCVCKQCFVPSIFLLPEDIGRHVLQFLPPRAARACMRAAKRFHRLLTLPFSYITRLEDYYSVDSERSLLGEGSFGVVYRCVCKRTGEPRACKVISKSKINSFGVAQLLLNEIRLHSQLIHTNTVPMFETLQSETDIFAVMGVAGDFELVDYIADKRQVEEAVAANILTQLFEFLDYLHREKCIVHRDLKPENIMLSSAHTTIKVVDFGLAKYMGSAARRSSLPAAENTVLCTPCGTLRYCAPEILAPRAYCERVPYDTVFKRDIYSVGVILYVMLTGHLPFRSGQLGELHRQMLKGPRFDGAYSSTVPSDARDLIKQLLSVNPAMRPTPAEALKHPWLASHAAMVGATHIPRRRTKAPPHEPPLLNVHVDLDHNGQLVTDHLQLSAYFDSEALKALEGLMCAPSPGLPPTTIQHLKEQGYFETAEGKQKLEMLKGMPPQLLLGASLAAGSFSAPAEENPVSPKPVSGTAHNSDAAAPSIP